MQLIIGNYNYSSWSLRPWFLLKHFELPFETVRIPLDTAEFPEQIAQYSKAGKVPVLIDQDQEIWDSLAICEYINEQYLGGGGWPAETLARAHARSISAEMHSSFIALRSAMPMNCRAQRRISFEPDVIADINRVQTIWKKSRNRFGEAGAWLLGDFSIADCMYAPVAARFNSYHPSLDEVSTDYVSKIIAHPAMQEWFARGATEAEVLDSEEVGEALN